MMTFFKRIFQKKKKTPHICKYTYSGYASHYGIIADIKDSIDNQTWYHYPPMEIRKQWLTQGHSHASVFQSHWTCECGYKKVFFFLSLDPNKIDVNELNIYNPFKSNFESGKSIDETIDEIINNLLNKD